MVEALVERYDGVVCDLDGVLVRGSDVLPGAGETLTALRERDVPYAVASNNAARTPEAITGDLQRLGVPVAASQVVTSAQAAARLIEGGTPCLVIGEEGLHAALSEVGAELVDDHTVAEAVVVGWDRGLVWDDLRRATLALAGGARFVATNADVSYPATEGPWPGNGAAVAALEAASGRRAEVCGKPHAPLFTAARERLGLAGDAAVLMVGDRHETDIAGAAALGWDTALVLSGITDDMRVATLDPPPTWVLAGVTGLVEPAPDDPRSGPLLRSARQEDLDAIVALWDAAGMLSYTPEPYRDLDAVRALDPAGVLVAEAGGDVVATVLATTDGRRGWLQRLVVAPEHRGTGLGRALVTEAERRLTARGVPQANLLHLPDNEEGERFWERLGYSRRMPVVLRAKRLEP